MIFYDAPGIGTIQRTGWYRRNGLWVKKRRVVFKDNCKCYKLIFNPALGWFPSKYASFQFEHLKEKILDVEYYWRRVPFRFNPSLWISKKGYYVLRVPKDRKDETIEALHRQRFFLYKKLYLWRRRKRVKIKQSSPSTL